MRRASNPALSPQLYKQFAMVTVFLTAAVAFFADGDTDQAAARAAQAPSLRERPAIASQASFRMPAGDAADPSPWNDHDSADFDEPAAAPPSTAPSLPPPLAGMSGVPGSGSPDITVGNAPGAPSAIIGGAAPTAAQIAAAEAASRLRSEAAGSDN